MTKKKNLPARGTPNRGAHPQADAAGGGAGAIPRRLPPGGNEATGTNDRQSTKDAAAGGNAPPPPHTPEPDPRIVALRQVAAWILRGENEISIEEAIKTKFPDEDSKTLFLAAFDYLSELAGTDAKQRRTWHIAARRELYRLSVEIHDYKTARDILRDLGQLEGLYPKMTPTKSGKRSAAEQPAGETTTETDGYGTLQ